MSDDIQLDLTEGATPAVKKPARVSSKNPKATAEPTLAERLYADRLSAGLHSEVSEDDVSITVGVKTAIVEIESSRQESEASNGNDRDLINQILGQVQATQAFSQFSRTLGVSKLAYVKESKTYKALKGQILNGSELSGTWDEFCSLLGMSADKADVDIANLRSFGEEALESMTIMGIGYRDFAQYRKLPADEKTALIEAAKNGDKNQLLDLAETLIEKHTKEKAELSNKLEELEQDNKSTGKRINNMDAEIERLTLVNERMKNKERLTKFEPYTEDVRDECMHLQAGVELHSSSLRKLFEDVFYAEATPEQGLRVEQVVVAINVAASRLLTMLEDVKHLTESYPIETIKGEHILTPPEAQRWLLDYQSLEAKHHANQAAREMKREADKPRGRGRPAGSTNKAND